MQGVLLIAIERPKERVRIVKIFRDFGFRVIEADSGMAAIALLRRNRRIGSAIVECAMSDLRGADFVSQIRATGVSFPLILLTNDHDMHSVQDALHAGATDYIDISSDALRLKQTFSMALKHAALERELHFLRREGDAELNFNDLCARSKAMQDARHIGLEAAAHCEPVLVEGESGCGRGLFSRIIHNESAYNKAPFMRLLCTDDGPEESTLLADLESALPRVAGGTICFIDIDRLDIEVQQKLRQTILDIGKKQGKSEAIRFIATSGVETHLLVEGGVFDASLHKMFSQWRIAVPPLRQRREDIPFLAEWFVAKIAANTGRLHIAGIHSAAEAFLMQHDWPGNLDELESCLFRAVVLARGPLLQIHDFPHLIRQKSDTAGRVLQKAVGSGDENRRDFFDLEGHIRTLAEIERLAIEAALKRYHGSMSEASRRLEIGRSTLYRKLIGNVNGALDDFDDD